MCQESQGQWGQGTVGARPQGNKARQAHHGLHVGPSAKEEPLSPSCPCQEPVRTQEPIFRPSCHFGGRPHRNACLSILPLGSQVDAAAWTWPPWQQQHEMSRYWAEAHIKIARMTLTIKLDRNWSSFQLANSAPPLSVTGSAIAPSARMPFSTCTEIHKNC